MNVQGQSGELVARLSGLLEEAREKNYSLYCNAIHETATKVDGLPEGWHGDFYKLLDSVTGKLQSLIEVREIKKTGLDEVFLVRALLGDVRTYLRRRASSTGISQADETRAHFRKQLEAILVDQNAFLKYKDALEKKHPEIKDASDDDLLLEVKSVLSNEVLQDVGLEEAAQRWSELEAWEALEEKWLSPETLSDWEDAREALGLVH